MSKGAPLEAGPLCLISCRFLEPVLHLVAVSYRFHNRILYRQIWGAVSTHETLRRPAAAAAFSPFSCCFCPLPLHPPYMVFAPSRGHYFHVILSKRYHHILNLLQHHFMAMLNFNVDMEGKYERRFNKVRVLKNSRANNRPE